MIFAGGCSSDMDIPLSQAAVIAYREVFTTRQEGYVPTNDELDLVALVLAGYVPIYGVREPGAPRFVLAQQELEQGMFWGGARRFESRRDPVPITRLTVQDDELRRALERLRAELASEP